MEEVNKHILGIIISINESETLISKNALTELFKAQQKEIDQLKEENKNIKREAKKYFKISNNNRMSVQIDNQNLKRDNTKLKEENQNIKDLHTLALNLNADLNLDKSNLKEEIRIFEEDAEIAMTDKRQRKIILNNHVKKLKK